MVVLQQRYVKNITINITRSVVFRFCTLSVYAVLPNKLVDGQIRAHNLNGPVKRDLLCLAYAESFYDMQS